ncbi:hypothetical protein C8Q75DRAFT_809554 [Abortiporus biennis]|nr:hypothetical protein C8Q75DRAFT_809554 [Abortiporus biennis]
MSTIPPTNGRPWWSRSKSTKDLPGLLSNHSATSLHEKSSSSKSSSSHSTSKAKESAGSKFNTLVATAIGKKSKRPTLTIQDPPPPLPTVRPPPSQPINSSSTDATPLSSPLSSSKRVPYELSTVRRYRDMDEASDPRTFSEPRTPSDHPRDRSSYQNSIMTLSDPDPFASTGMILSPFPPEPNRLSVYSDKSMLDPSSKRNEAVYNNNRISYGSSSSASHTQSHDSHGMRSPASMNAAGRGQISRRPSENSMMMHRRQPSNDEVFQMSSQPLRQTRSMQASGGSVSSHSTVTPLDTRMDNSYASSSRSRPIDRPALRARGMTVAGVADSNSSVAPGNSFNFHNTPPLQLRRKASETILSQRSPSTSTPPSYSPISFSPRSSSPATGNSSPVSSVRPVVLVRKASSSRLLVPPLAAAPPSSNLPPPPPTPDGAVSFLEGHDEVSSQSFPTRPTSVASTVSFASGMGLDADGDAIFLLMRDMRDSLGITGDDLQLSPPATGRKMKVQGPPHSARLPYLPHHSDPPLKSLKKAVSQQNLLGKRSSNMSVASVTSNVFGMDDSPFGGTSSPSVKAPKKQRSFHHGRFPIPVITSLRHHNSNSSSTQAETSQSGSSSDQKKSSNSREPRKRLFSGSSSIGRSSTSQPPSSPTLSAEDDFRSCISVDSETTVENRPTSKPIMMSFSNFGNHISLMTETACVAATWDENDYAVNKRESQDYVPQHIMSPAAMLELEQQLTIEKERKGQDGNDLTHKSTPTLQLDPADLGLHFSSRKSTRSRSNSTRSDRSIGTLSFGKDGPVGKRASGAASSIRSPTRPETSPVVRSPIRHETSPVIEHHLHNLHSPLRSTSMLAKATITPLKSPRRPSTAQPALSPPTSPTTPTALTLTERPSTALPPPPRPRTQSSKTKVEDNNNVPATKRGSVFIHPLSPPPHRRPSRVTISTEDREQPLEQTHHPPSSFSQRMLNRRSVARRPSFLEIDDDGEADVEVEGEVEDVESTEMESSFLDLDRGKDSFDTLRSFDDEVRVY